MEDASKVELRLRAASRSITMVIIVFRSRIRESANQAELEHLGQRMVELASSMPGYISYKDFIAADGENVSIVEFESLETLAAWREHPEHRLAQQRGRQEFFADYHIQVCAPVRDYAFQWDGQG
jgi:heme-degrading monooxygenase HmoA